MPSASDTPILENAFDGGCAVPLGFEVADIPGPQSGRMTHSAIFLAAFAAVLLLHALLFLVWRAEHTPPPRAPGPGIGAGGMQISLVSALPGVPLSTTTVVLRADAREAEGAAVPPSPEATPSTGPDGEGGPDTSTPELGHASGLQGFGTATAANGSPGGGFDPGAFASMAPLSFSHGGEPGLWAQVQRCFKEAPTQALTLTVVLDEHGAFVDAYKETGELSVAPLRPDEAAASRVALDALKACSPYHDLPNGLDRRLTLYVPVEEPSRPTA